MASLKSQLLDLLAFNDWATRVILEAATGLSPEEWARDVGGSFGSVRDTAGHMVGAEWIWLERWKGGSPSSTPEWLRNPTAASLAERWEEVAAERNAWLEGRSEEALSAELSYSRLDGEAGSNRLEILVRHVVNHSTYHRGQIAAFLRDLGRTPPSTDMVRWDRLRSA